MKKVKELIALWSVFLSLSLSAQEKMKLPSADELNSINDSIVQEGYHLYLMEKVSWDATDYFLKKCEDRSQVKGYVTLWIGNDSLSTIFYNREEKMCVGQVIFDLSNEEYHLNTQPRELDSLELERIDRRIKAFCQINIADANGLSINKSYLQLDDKKARVFCLQGVSSTNVIPFGNDAYADFDFDGNLLKTEKFHNTYIPVNLPINKKSVGTICHSHLSDNPYITPSDIATFLLYGRNLYHLNSFYVYSVAFDCFFKFDSESMKITIENPETSDSSGKAAEPFSYDKIKLFVEKNRVEYDELLTRFRNADSTLTDEDMKIVYYGFSFTESYTGMGTIEETTIKKLLRDSKIEEAKLMLDSALDNNPVNTGLLKIGFNLYASLNDNDHVEKFRWQITKLIDTILLSGEGTKDSPMYVIDVSDEYTTMYQALGVTKMKQQSIAGICDLMDVSINEIEAEIYFDTRRSLQRMKEIYCK